MKAIWQSLEAAVVYQTFSSKIFYFLIHLRVIPRLTFMHLFIDSFIEYLMNTYYIQSTNTDIKDIAVYKKNKSFCPHGTCISV